MPPGLVFDDRERALNFAGQIDELCAQLNSGHLSREDFIEQCLRIASAQVGCARAGLWVFFNSPEGRRMRCLGMFDRAEDRVLMVADRDEYDASAYFDELERVGHVLANDARVHPATRSFFHGPFLDRGLISLMAAAFALNGRLFGAFTCTHDEPTEWSIRQLAILNKIGSRVTLSLAGVSTSQLDSLLGLL